MNVTNFHSILDITAISTVTDPFIEAEVSYENEAKVRG